MVAAGARFVSHGRQVGLFPQDRGFAATFYEPVADYEYRLYVDVTTVPEVTAAGVVTAVDLDLDVIERFDGTWFFDDEDEFAEHQVLFGYPAEPVAEAQSECARLSSELASQAPHFAEPLATHWRHELANLTR